MLLKFPKGPQCPLTATTHRGQPRAQPSASLGLWERRARTNTAGVGSSVASPVPVQLGKPFLFYHHYYNYLILQAAAVLAGDTHKAAKKPTEQEGPGELAPLESLTRPALALSTCLGGGLAVWGRLTLGHLPLCSLKMLLLQGL